MTTLAKWALTLIDVMVAINYEIITKWLLFWQPDDYPGVRFQGKHNRVRILENFKGFSGDLGYTVRAC